MREREGDWIQTYTGKVFWPLDPEPDEIDIEDVAHALSLKCRFNGQCDHFFSVAAHSVMLFKSVRSPMPQFLPDLSEYRLRVMPHCLSDGL